ncbi:MAG TPA: copper resistance protein CopC [Candidatus Limnocylindrales bacterium]
MAGALLLAGPILIGPAAPVALAHAELVTSAPAAGDVVATAPPEIRLVFSETIDGAYTRLDLLDPLGHMIADGIGAPDPSDPYTLVAPIEPLPDGLYTVNWQALSRADGHRTSGFFTFGVGDVAPPAGGGQDAGGSIHAGHDAVTALIETESRFAQLLGLLLAVGLPVFVFTALKIEPSRRLGQAGAGALLIAAVGAFGLLAVNAAGFGTDPVAYARDTRSGQLLAAGALLALAGGLVVLGLARRRSPAALLLTGAAGIAGLVIVALGGHAAAFVSTAPLAVILVHSVTGAIWMTGVIVLAAIALTGSPVPRSALPQVVPRFSALAVASVGLLALSGLYSDWVQTGAIVSVATPYDTTLLVKVLLAALAFAIGAVNFIGGGAVADRRFGPRVTVEAALAIGVIVATAVLTSGAPPSQDAPIQIARATSTGSAGGFSTTLALAPGRPGPTRFVVTVAPVPEAGHTVDLQLTRLDATGDSRVTMRPSATAGTFQSAGGLLPANSGWDATVIVRGPDTIEQSRTRFAFALDATTISEGRATPPVDPVLVIALLLLAAAAIGGVLLVARSRLPRVDQAVGRGALAAGAACALVLGLVVLVGGSRP